MGVRGSRRARRTVAGASALLVLLAAAWAVSASSASGASSKKVIVLHQAGIAGDATEAILGQFEKETGIRVVGISGTDADYGPKLKLAAQSKRAQWDVALGTTIDQFNALDSTGVFAPLNLTRWKKTTVAAYRARHLIGTDWVGGQQDAAVLVYSNSLAANPPKTWADFFNTEKYPGNRGIAAGGAGAPIDLEYALLADGVTPGRLYPLDLKRAVSKLSSVKGSLVLWDSAPQGIESVVRGDTLMAWVYSPAAAKAVAAKQPIKITVPPGTAVEQSRDAVLAHGPHPDLGQVFLRWWDQPRIQARFSKLTNGGLVVPTKPTLALIPATMRAFLPFAPPNERSYRYINYGWYSQKTEGRSNLDRTLEAFQAFQVGG